MRFGSHQRYFKDGPQLQEFIEPTCGGCFHRLATGGSPPANGPGGEGGQAVFIKRRDFGKIDDTIRHGRRVRRRIGTRAYRSLAAIFSLNPIVWGLSPVSRQTIFYYSRSKQNWDLPASGNVNAMLDLLQFCHLSFEPVDDIRSRLGNSKQIYTSCSRRFANLSLLYHFVLVLGPISLALSLPKRSPTASG